MLLSFIVIFSLAVLLGILFEKIKLPALLAYMAIGICVSPYAAIYLEPQSDFLKSLFLTHRMTSDSAILREIALYIILFRAGLGLDRTGLKTHGMNAISLSIIPCLFEAFIVSSASMLIFKLPMVESFLIGFVIAAVSPAVIVPQMLKLKEEGIGTKKKIPTLVLAGSTIDDIVAISGFGICLAMLAPEANNDWRQIVFKIPFSVLTGAVIGFYLAKPIINGLKISRFHKFFFVPILIAIAFGFKQLEESNLFFFSHLFAILSLGISIQYFDFDFSESLSKGFAQVWSVAVVILFVLIGAMVNPETAINAGANGLMILIIGLCARSAAVYASLYRSSLNGNEIIFCIISYLPKATVQATIGGITLSMFIDGKIWLYEGAATGDLIIAMAALSILVTAPLGAIGIRVFSKKLLKDSSTSNTS